MYVKVSLAHRGLISNPAVHRCVSESRGNCDATSDSCEVELVMPCVCMSWDCVAIFAQSLKPLLKAIAQAPMSWRLARAAHDEGALNAALCFNAFGIVGCVGLGDWCSWVLGVGDGRGRWRAGHEVAQVAREKTPGRAREGQGAAGGGTTDDDKLQVGHATHLRYLRLRNQVFGWAILERARGRTD